MSHRVIRPTCSNSRPMNLSRGHLFIISAPSGAGKTTLTRAVLSRCVDILYSISYTTRAIRSGEQDGIDYYFVTPDKFKQYINHGKWAEWAEVHGNYYGTSAEFIDENLAAGRDIILDIDVQGAAQLVKRYPDSITIFIMPPSLETLRERLESRGTDKKAAIAKRLENAQKEMAKKDLYRYVIVNDRLPDAVAELISIIEKYRT